MAVAAVPVNVWFNTSVVFYRVKQVITTMKK
jgi:hypothetical protein